MIENRASRTLSAVGGRRAGAMQPPSLSSPATTRIRPEWGPGRSRSASITAPRSSACSGSASDGIGGDQLVGPGPRPLEQLLIVG